MNYQEHLSMDNINLCVFTGHNGSGKDGFIVDYLHRQPRNSIIDIGKLDRNNRDEDFVKYAVEKLNIIFPYSGITVEEFNCNLSERRAIRNIYAMFESMKTKKIAYIKCPENDLHPLGQTEMGKIASEMAHLGAKIIIKTHSLFFIDGMRIFAKENKAKSGVCRIFSVKPPLDITEIDIDSDGTLSESESITEQFFDNYLKLLI